MATTYPVGTVRLTTPWMGSNKQHAALRNRVARYQRCLTAAGIRVKADGVAGPETCSGFAVWKRRFGFADKFCVNNLTLAEAEWLTGKKKQTPAMKLRAAKRNRKPVPAAPPVRATQSMTAWAKAGWRENPAYSNKVPQMAALAKSQGLSAWYQAMGWPWCAFATSLSAKAAGSKTAELAFKLPEFNELYVPDILYHARRGEYGMRVVSLESALPGDWAVFNFDGGEVDHIGTLIRKIDGLTIETVEGNTSPNNMGSQADGGGVYLRTRPVSQVTTFIRFS